MVEINVAGYGYLRLAPKAPFARRDSHRSITQIYTAFANISEWIWCVIQTTYSYLKQFLRHKTRVNNTRNVDRFCDSIICTLGPNYVTIRVGNHPFFLWKPLSASRSSLPHLGSWLHYCRERRSCWVVNCAFSEAGLLATLAFDRPHRSSHSHPSSLLCARFSSDVSVFWLR